MIKKKHLSPELREQYEYWEQKFMTKHRKKHLSLFLLWLFIWLLGVSGVLFLEPNIFVSFCFMLWAIAGLTGTLIFNHRCIMYIEAHIYDKPAADDPLPAPEEAPENPEAVLEEALEDLDAVPDEILENMDSVLADAAAKDTDPDAPSENESKTE